MDQNPSWDVCKPGDHATRNVWPLWLPTRVSAPSTKSCFAWGSNIYLTWFVIWYSVSIRYNKPTIKIINPYLFLSGQIYKISRGSNNYFPHCIYVYVCVCVCVCVCGVWCVCVQYRYLLIIYVTKYLYWNIYLHKINAVLLNFLFIKFWNKVW